MTPIHPVRACAARSDRHSLTLDALLLLCSLAPHSLVRSRALGPHLRDTMPLQNSTAHFGVRPDALLPQPPPSSAPIDYALQHAPRGLITHHSNLVSTAHSRDGYYPQDGLVPEVTREAARGYVENRDQPFHAQDDDESKQEEATAQAAGVGQESLGIEEWRARVAQEEEERRRTEEAQLMAMGQPVPPALSSSTARRSKSRGGGDASRDQRLQVWERDPMHDSPAGRSRSTRHPSPQQQQSFQATRLFPGLRSKQDSTAMQMQMVERPVRAAKSVARGSSTARSETSYPPRPQSQQESVPWPAARSYEEYDRAVQEQEAHAAAIAAAAAEDADAASATPAHHHPSFSASSPIASFNALRAMSAMDPSAAALMTTLSPRSHSRQMAAYLRPPPQPVRPRPYHPSLNAPRSARAASGSGSGSSSGATANLTRPYPHRHPFLPCNPAQARSIFKDGPFLTQPPTPPPQQQQRAGQTGRAASAQGLRASSAHHQLSLTGGAGDGAPVLRLRDTTAPPVPFRGSTSVLAARESTAVDYYLNSPDAAIKRLERAWVGAQARANRAAFVDRLASTQRAEREDQARQAAREGRVTITHALPPRPLSFSDGRFKAQ